MPSPRDARTIIATALADAPIPAQDADWYETLADAVLVALTTAGYRIVSDEETIQEYAARLIDAGAIPSAVGESSTPTREQIEAVARVMADRLYPYTDERMTMAFWRAQAEAALRAVDRHQPSEICGRVQDERFLPCPLKAGHESLHMNIPVTASDAVKREYGAVDRHLPPQEGDDAS